ncbi:MAG: tRNA (adenosine(37)-N6)-threonylcarbamoyltransferase complex ATPase subunit type 1 TsaE [Chlamydiota bacterium]|nr:tRNA (adenosine(37)-N6)-threonylcarbamoyltransferase complex ATPase subunit type 1 TsaE [Chlamydiota bacterium]
MGSRRGIASLLPRESSSPEETLLLGGEIAEAWLPPYREPLLLTGSLGAGKTTLVRGIATAWGVESSLIHSPTFSYIHHYQGATISLYHIDLYRLEGGLSGEIRESIESEYPTLVEWGERALEEFPHALHLSIESLGPTKRKIEVIA